MFKAKIFDISKDLYYIKSNENIYIAKAKEILERKILNPWWEMMFFLKFQMIILLI